MANNPLSDISNNFENILDTLENITISNNKRLDWNKYFMGLALWSKQRSVCDRLKVGCVIVKDNRLICMGYNGFLPNSPHISIVRDNHEIATVHAEQNAISDAASRGVSIKDSIIYITHYPCINCFKSIVSSGIKTIYYHNEYKNDIIVNDLALHNGIKIIKL